MDKTLAGGSSVKSTYSQLRIFLTNFFGSKGIPLPSEISIGGFPKEDNADASDSWDEDVPKESSGVSELELSAAAAGVNVAVSAGNDPASVVMK